MKAILLLCFGTCAGAAVPNVAFLEGASPAVVAADSQGNIVIAGQTASSALPVTPGALQTTFGGHIDAFVAKFAPDGTLLWCTYFGGSSYDYASGVAVDSSDNVLVTGFTQSTNLPVLNAFQNTLQGNANAFVLKLNPAGQLLYSTYLGGSGYIQANAIAVDKSGSAYVTGPTSTEDFPGQPAGTVGTTFVAKLDASGAFVYSFIYSRNVVGPRAIAVDSSGSAYVVGQPAGATNPVPNLRVAFVFKLSPDGTHLLYEAFFGGSQNNNETAIAVDNTGAAYIAGTTDSADFPRVHALQSSLNARPLWKSGDAGDTWTPVDNLPFAYLRTLVPDPTTPGTVYAGASDLGVFKSANNGGDWTRISNGITTPEIYSLGVTPSALYAAGGFPDEGNTQNDGFVFGSTNGGANWAQVDSLLYNVTSLSVDPVAPSNLYAVTGTGAVKTSNGGSTWTTISLPTYLGIVTSIVPDPNIEGTVYAYSANEPCLGPFGPCGDPPETFRSTDGAATWQQLSVSPGAPGLVVDPSTNPATIYAGVNARSNNGGATWSALTAPFGIVPPSVLAVDPSNGTLYAANVASNALSASADRGQTWNLTGWPYAYPPITGITPTSGALYAAVQNIQTSAFVVKLSPDGSTVEYATLLNGHPAMANPVVQSWEPTAFSSQNWASGIALDSSGDIVVTGGTRSLDFPTASPAQSANAGGVDAFVVVISADGSQLKYSTYLGGSLNDGASGVTVDPQGNVIVAGLTSSPDFLGGTVPQSGSGSAFVARVISDPPTITAVLSAASFQPGIEAGSWVMIKGANLASATGTWQASDFVGNNLPTVVDGVSVTIDGKPAFVEYVSPTQINVQAPSDNATGTVNVLVNNNGQASVPATAQLQTAAPAFFMSGTNVVASVLPDYTLVTATAPAMPGDLVVLWGTGFGPTNPSAPAGIVVSGAPATLTLPIVTVGGMQVPVVGSVLTTGTVGLYQITVQLPANVPTGNVAVQASIGGAQTQSGVTLFVGVL